MLKWVKIKHSILKIVFFSDDDEGIIKRFNRTFRFADINNDSLPDICYRDKYSYMCRLNTGVSFSEPKEWIHLDKDYWPFHYIKYKAYGGGSYF